MAALVANSVEGALALVPWTLQQTYFEGKLDVLQPVVHHGAGAVLFADASGFTALSSALADDAATLAKCLNTYYSVLIPVIHAYNGDLIKFSGDAVIVYFPSDEMLGLSPLASAVLRASACAIELMSNELDTGVDDIKLRMHIGVGCGDVTIYQLGGACLPQSNQPQYECVLCGPALEQTAIAEPLAKHGEAVLSTQAWEQVEGCVIEGVRLEDRPDFHALLRLAAPYDIESVKHATGQHEHRADMLTKFGGFGQVDIEVLRRYVPTFPVSVSEMRKTSVAFISINASDCATDDMPGKLQEIVLSVQKCCFAFEGSLNKTLIADKGMLFLMIFGLPPFEHSNDPSRAVLACLDIAKVIEQIGFAARMGVTSNQSFCGLVGNHTRMEYTVLGDGVNLAARLMSNAPAHGILCDEETRNASAAEVEYDSPTSLRIKGKAEPVLAFLAGPNTKKTKE